MKLQQDYQQAQQSGVKLKPQTEKLVQSTLAMGGGQGGMNQMAGQGGMNPMMGGMNQMGGMNPMGGIMGGGMQRMI